MWTPLCSAIRGLLGNVHLHLVPYIHHLLPGPGGGLREGHADCVGPALHNRQWRSTAGRGRAAHSLQCQLSPAMVVRGHGAAGFNGTRLPAVDTMLPLLVAAIVTCLVARSIGTAEDHWGVRDEASGAVQRAHD